MKKIKLSIILKIALIVFFLVLIAVGIVIINHNKNVSLEEKYEKKISESFDYYYASLSVDSMLLADSVDSFQLEMLEKTKLLSEESINLLKEYEQSINDNHIHYHVFIGVKDNQDKVLIIDSKNKNTFLYDSALNYRYLNVLEKFNDLYQLSLDESNFASSQKNTEKPKISLFNYNGQLIEYYQYNNGENKYVVQLGEAYE